jgi:hypothetical protein
VLEELKRIRVDESSDFDNYEKNEEILTKMESDHLNVIEKVVIKSN